MRHEVTPPRRSEKPVIGWREWLAIPELRIPTIKAKVDTGARTSSLHAFDVEIFRERGKRRVRFKVHPLQRDTSLTVSAVADLHDLRVVRDSGGKETLRPVILVEVVMAGVSWPIELTLASRDSMGFRMLLGRQALKNKFLVNPGRSHLGTKKKKAVMR